MTDTNQDPNYQDILTKYADSLKSTEEPKIPEPETPPQTSPETQLDSVPEEKSEMAPTAPPTILEPDPDAQVVSEAEPQTAVMTDTNGKAEVTMPTTETSEATDKSDTADKVESNTQEDVSPAPQTEAKEIVQPDVQIPPSMMQESPVENLNDTPSSPTDDFIPPAPHPIGIAPDFVPPKENHFFKYLFFFSLVVFIVVAALVIYSFVNSQKSLDNSKSTPTSTPPTEVPGKSCEINGQKYIVNETFPATDGCNTCSCSTDLEIVCTEKACDATESASTPESATESAVSPSPTIIPEATIVP